MKRIFFYLVLLPFLAGILSNCARQGIPTGGPKDVQPPRVDSLVSTPSMTTQFKARRILLTFDEWITLSETGQILFSPPLAKRPAITLHDKTITVEWATDEILRPNTTYTINFGNSVKDFHEGNIAKDLRFVFSTGDAIDSLSVKGKVVNAFTGEPAENISVMLYDNISDSIIRKERPYYLAKTDKTGLFTLQNLHAGQYKVVAFEDADQNLKWSESEKIAFRDSLLVINDNLRAPLSLQLFENQGGMRRVSDNAKNYGLVRLVYNGPPDSVRLQAAAPGLRIFREQILDTLLVWYDLDQPIPWQLLANTDTIAVKTVAREEFLKTHQLRLAGDVSANRSSRRTPPPPVVPGATTAPASRPAPLRSLSQNPAKPAVFTFNTPLVGLDSTKWILQTDSILLTDFKVTRDTGAAHAVRLAYPWKLGRSYTLVVLPGAVTDFYQVANTDTLRFLLSVPTEKQLGGLNLTLKMLTPGNRYVLTLLNGTQLEETRTFTADAVEKRLAFTRLPTAVYTVRLLEDRVGNGRWDAGDYFGHRQPEQVFSKKLEALRANWEVEATMNAGANEAPPPTPKEQRKRN